MGTLTDIYNRDYDTQEDDTFAEDYRETHFGGHTWREIEVDRKAAKQKKNDDAAG